MKSILQIRTFVPLAIRQEIKHYQRQLEDRKNGLKLDAHKSSQEYFSKLPYRIQISQPILNSGFFHQKVHNLGRGASLLSYTLIEPESIWSFWQQLGRADKKNGFVEGRNLVAGKIKTQVGGGLCQLSSLTYHLALRSGLRIIERHAHSVDIYNEEQRYTPLGSDATVSWGVKDLRLQNPYSFNVGLIFYISANHLIGELCSNLYIEPSLVEFLRQSQSPDKTTVETLCDGKLVDVTNYQNIRLQS